MWTSSSSYRPTAFAVPNFFISNPIIRLYVVHVIVLTLCVLCGFQMKTILFLVVFSHILDGILKYEPCDEVGFSVVILGLAPLYPVTPNGDFTATFGDFKFGLVTGDRCVVAFNRRHQYTDRNRSQRFCTSTNANRPTMLRLYSECALRLYSNLRKLSATARSAVVVRSYNCRTSNETVHRALSDHCDHRQTLQRPAVIGRDCLINQHSSGSAPEPWTVHHVPSAVEAALNKGTVPPWFHQPTNMEAGGPSPANLL